MWVLGMREATFWQTTCFSAFLHVPSQRSPWWCLTLCNVLRPPPTHPNQLWTTHPKGKSAHVLPLISVPAEPCCTPMLRKPLTDVAWGQATAWMVVILQALPCVAIFMPPSSLWETLGDSHKFVIHHRSHSRLNAIFPQRGFIKRKFMP